MRELQLPCDAVEDWNGILLALIYDQHSLTNAKHTGVSCFEHMN